MLRPLAVAANTFNLTSYVGAASALGPWKFECSPVAIAAASDHYWLRHHVVSSLPHGCCRGTAGSLLPVQIEFLGLGY